MSERRELLPGSFCWPELATPDSARAKEFYAGLFGWGAFDVPSAGGTYTLLQLRGLDVAALRLLGETEKKQGVPSHFMTYVSVASADAGAARARELGGAVLAGPFDVEGIGRMAVINDPTGATFALWEARGHIGARLVGEEHTLCWSEIATPDPAATQAFYGGLFGWTWKGSPEYGEIYREEQPIGGLLPMRDGQGGDRPRWTPYFRVADCDAAVARAVELGGGVVVPPREIAEAGRFAVLRDSQGACFSVIAFPEEPPAS